VGLAAGGRLQDAKTLIGLLWAHDRLRRAPDAPIGSTLDPVEP
jgi:hypothetical protein